MEIASIWSQVVLDQESLSFLSLSFLICKIGLMRTPRMSETVTSCSKSLGPVSFLLSSLLLVSLPGGGDDP